jgi:two-component system, chemotaxis family, protein-glutamate methylesterase/glutaminase
MAENAVRYKTVVIGGSAGSLDVILKIISSMPFDLDIVFIIIVHRKNDADSILNDLLSSRTKMAVKEVEDKQPIQPNTIYIAPPDYHLLLEDEYTFSLDSSEKVHYSRPSIDVTFESVAQVFGSAAIGVLLSGANADGAAGLHNIKDAGGFTIVQDPSSSQVGFMPQQAINRGSVGAVLHEDEIPGYIERLLRK